MIAIPLGVTTVDEALRAVRALGAHRYVAGRMHCVHAFAFAAAGAGETQGLEEGRAWAREILRAPDIDAASRDERLWRRSTEAELVAILGAFWIPGPRAKAVRAALEAYLAQHDLPIPAHEPFDESQEESTHPLLVDAGWELLTLGQLDAQRHAGAIGAFGEALSFESARFEEETCLPAVPCLYEAPAIGPVELLRAIDEHGRLAAPFVLWAQGHDTYLDYVVRGVRRAAKLPEASED